MKRLPIQAAKDIAKKYNQDQVILVTWDKAAGLMHVVSYGKSLADCKQAAMGANKVKRALGFPDALCHDEPARAKRERARKEGEQNLQRIQEREG